MQQVNTYKQILDQILVNNTWNNDYALCKNHLHGDSEI